MLKVKKRFLMLLYDGLITKLMKEKKYEIDGCGVGEGGE
jgi:hypothetical protein